MSAETYTLRDVVLAEREAFIAGVNTRARLDVGDDWKGAAHEAAKRYPLPKVTRPRVLSDGAGMQYSVIIDGERLVIQYRHKPNEMWSRTFPGVFTIDAVRAQIFADLLANPTEEVEVGP